MKSLAFDQLRHHLVKSSGNEQGGISELFVLNTCGFERQEVVEVSVALVERLVSIQTFDSLVENYVTIERSNISFSQVSGDKGLVLGNLSRFIVLIFREISTCKAILCSSM